VKMEGVRLTLRFYDEKAKQVAPDVDRATVLFKPVQREQERRVLEALSGPVSVAYDPVADRMTLVPANGHAVLAFERDP